MEIFIIYIAFVFTLSYLQTTLHATQPATSTTKSHERTSEPTHASSLRISQNPVLRVPLQEDEPEVVTRSIRVFGLDRVKDVVVSPDNQYALIGSDYGFAVLIHLENKTYDRLFFCRQ